jgi:hypothetical protein
LPGLELIEKPFQGFGLAVLSDKQHAPADIIEDHGQVAVALADGDLVDSQ